MTAAVRPPDSAWAAGARIETLEQYLGTLCSDPLLVSYRQQTVSTMQDARLLLQSSEKEGPLWGLALAESQQDGRGRLAGRSWQSPPGNLYVTYMVSLDSLAMKDTAGLSLVAGCSVAAFLRKQSAQVFLKWPNDIQSESGAKLGGILVELYQHKGGHVAFVGLGLNLRSAPEGATHLSAEFSQCKQLLNMTPALFAGSLFPQLLKDIRMFTTAGFAGFRERWLSYRAQSKELLVTLGDQKEKVYFLGITDRGALVVNHGGKVVELLSGDVAVL